MILLGHQCVDDVAGSARDLRALGSHALRLMSEVVEQQGVTRSQASKTALALEDAGFVFIRERGIAFDSQIRIVPSLAGEEALAFLDGDFRE